MHRFVGVLLGGAGGLGGEGSGDAELNGDGGGAFVGLLRLSDIYLKETPMNST